MQIAMIGEGALARALVALATRAGNAVVAIDGTATDVAACSRSEMMIVAGDRAAVHELVARVAAVASVAAVIVDATTNAMASEGAEDEDASSGTEWMSLLPSMRIVRAFASVPVEAFEAIVAREPAGAGDELAVPLAGDDVAAKDVVSGFMRQIGVEPFDVGPLTVSYVLEPGGPLWGKAVDSLDMRECIGWLSGDG